MDLAELPKGSFVRHPWEEARARFFERQLARADLFGKPLSVLDVGSGDAWFAARLSRAHPELDITCWDRAYNQGTPGHERLHYTSTQPRTSFDLILLLDVAEHVADDHAFLSSTLASLRAGGSVLFSVPAWPFLYSAHDAGLGHHRRYSAAEARRLLRASDLVILSAGGLFHSLLLPRLALKLYESFTPRGAKPPAAPRTLEWRGGAPLRQAFLSLLAFDARLSELAARAEFDLPGLSFWALCRRSPS